MTARGSSATDLGADFVAALAERDFDRLAGTFAADVRMRALIPPGPIDLLGANPAAARFATWFGKSDGFELVHSGSDEVGDRLHVFYRLRVKRPRRFLEGHRAAPLLRARRGPHYRPRSRLFRFPPRSRSLLAADSRLSSLGCPSVHRMSLEALSLDGVEGERDRLVEG